MKICTKCGEPKCLSEFYRDIRSHSPDERRYACKECEKESHLKYKRSIAGIVSRMYSDQKKLSKKRKYALPNYTKKELYCWVISQDNFNLLLSDWIVSGYKRELSLSCDRINDYLPYSLDNIQLSTTKYNIDKSHNDSMLGINSKKLKAVVGINIISGEKVEFYSIAEACRKTGAHNSNVTNSCKNNDDKAKSSAGYRWFYKDEYYEKQSD